MNGQQAVRRAQALFQVLPKAGFTKSTFMELGEASSDSRMFRTLSTELKRTLFLLVAEYSKELSAIATEERITSAAFAAQVIGKPEQVPGWSASDASQGVPEATDDEDDEAANPDDEDDADESETDDEDATADEESAVTTAQDQGPAKHEPQDPDPFADLPAPVPAFTSMTMVTPPESRQATQDAGTETHPTP